MGFKKLTEKHEASRILYSLKQLKELSSIHTGNSLPKPDPIIHYILMSDTLLLFSEKDDEKSFKYISGIVAETICHGMGLSATSIATQKTPMRFRGAISVGDFCYEVEDKIFFGPAFNDAFYWEKKQEWIGAILTPTCNEFVQKHGYDISSLIEYDAPLKNDMCRHIVKAQKCLCIDWTAGFACKDVPPTKKFQGQNENSEFENKLDNTYKFYRYAQQIN
ncbi:MAG: hypothetical protein Q8M71_06285 [Thermodesulfovibrionales bacterium]|nr:hypothetical protein [Thermodesulfovibrionales bacterium]